MEPYPPDQKITVRAFIFRYKRGTIFPAGAVLQAISEMPQELQEERRTWDEWMEEFKEYM